MVSAGGSPSPILEARTGDAGSTRSLAGALAGVVRPGDLVVLAGDLGAGKTAFVQGFGAALGVTDRITSPTFTIAQQYPATIEGHRGARQGWLHHLDAYRLTTVGELADVGLAELLDEGGVVVVEWGDMVTPALPSEYLEVRIRFSAGDGDAGAELDRDDQRHLALRAVGRPWVARSQALADAVAPWRVTTC